MIRKSPYFYLFACILCSLGFPDLVLAQFCPALPAPPPNSPTVSTSQELINAVNGAQPDTTIYIADGTYRGRLNINTDGLTLRSLSGDRDKVILDGGSQYSVDEPIAIHNAKDVTIADLTIKRAFNHLVHVSGNSHRTKLYNLKLIDAREQFIKINFNGDAPDFGEIACSHFELTSAGRDFVENNPTPGFLCYTGGIDTHEGDGWTVRDNYFRDIYCTNGGLAEHCIHFWDGADNTVVERNIVVNCGRGIGFGLGSQGTKGGRIVNNFVCVDNIPGSPGPDVSIGLERAEGALVAYNSVYVGNGYASNSIELRFPETNGTAVNNLTTTLIRDRNNPQSGKRNNYQGTAALFTAPGVCDLHLKAGAAGIGDVVDQAENIQQEFQVNSDIDGGARGSSPDIGADELGQSGGDSVAPNSPTNLRTQ